MNIQKTIARVSFGALATVAILAMSSGLANADSNSTSTSSTASSTVPSVDLAVTKTIDNPTPLDGAMVNYMVTAADLGTSTATGVTVEDLLPAGLVFDSATTSQGSYDVGSGLWTVGDIAASGTATLNVGVTIAAASGTTIVNTATGNESASSSDPNMSNNSASASLTVANATTTAPAPTSTLTVDIAGLATTTTSLSVTDLTLGTTTATATVGNGSTLFAINTGDDYTVTAGAVAGYAMTDSTGCSGILASSNTCTVTFVPTVATSTPIADLTIMKTVDNANPMADTDVNYTLTVSALGPNVSTAAMATDILPAGLTFVSATPSEGSYASSTGVWNIGDMAPSSTATLMIATLVDPGTSGQTITNTATVSESSSVMNTNASTSSAMPLTVLAATSTPTSTGSLAVSCDWGYDASNVITWTSSVSGGTAPYTYLWSGPQVGGNTSSSVTATYPTTGAYDATVQVTDSASNTGSATCSASVLSVTPPASTSTPPTPTSTPPFIPPTLSIGSNGAFSADGMVVTGVASTSFDAEIWGITYTINWTGKLPKFFFRNGNDDSRWVPSAQLNIGDIVSVIGTVDPTNPLVVNAQSVRDFSITGPRPRRSDFPVFNFQNQGNNNGYGNGNMNGNGNNGSSSNGNGYGSTMNSYNAGNSNGNGNNNGDGHTTTTYGDMNGHNDKNNNGGGNGSNRNNNGNGSGGRYGSGH